MNNSLDYWIFVEPLQIKKKKPWHGNTLPFYVNICLMPEENHKWKIRPKAATTKYIYLFVDFDILWARVGYGCSLESCDQSAFAIRLICAWRFLFKVVETESFLSVSFHSDRWVWTSPVLGRTLLSYMLFWSIIFLRFI